MKVGLLVIAFNVDQWLYEMLQNASSHVDIAYIAYPSRPWKYSEEARSSEVNPTVLSEDRLADTSIDYRIVRGDWDYDEDTRNAIREIATNESCDWLVVQDADEFYDDQGWETLKALMRMHLGEEVAITTKWLNFWKNTNYVVVNRDGTLTSANECAALSLSGSSSFTYSRTVSCRLISSDVVCFHLGYVMNDAQAKLKVRTWAHTADVDVRSWYNLKWKRWNLRSKYLHPGNPPVWHRAIRKPPEIILPEQCKHYSEDYMRNTFYASDGKWHLGILEFIYDQMTVALYLFKRLRGKARFSLRLMLSK